MNDAINALGYVEVLGFAAAVETADAMVKCAPVRFLRQLQLDAARITLVVEGELGACRAAVDAGSERAQRLGALIAATVMGRPAEDTASFVLRLAEAGRRPFGATQAKSAPAKTAAPPNSVETKTEIAAPAPKTPVAKPLFGLDAELVDLLAKREGETSAPALARLLGREVGRVRERLEALAEAGKLAKRRGRYLLASAPPAGAKR